MTDLTLIIRQPSLFATLFRSLIEWLNEPVAASTPLQRGSRDWADLPSYHPIRDDRDAR